MKDNQHIKFMKIALALAARNIGLTAPNPCVACVIVKDNQIIATGITAPGGRPHAEVVALAKAGENAKGATAYVTLEPCCHTGKTPPCSDALIKAGIARVVVALQDPYKEVAGNGIKQLKAAGIEVITGICEAEAAELNAGFLKVQAKKRPFVTLKLATSIDGKIATSIGDSKWISGEKSRAYVHMLRAKNDAIMVGIDTVCADDPELTCRLPGLLEQSPIRVVIDTNLRIPEDSKLVKSAKNHPLWVITAGEQVNKAKLEALGVKVIACKSDENGRVDIADTLKTIAKLGITSLLVEGGSKLASSFIQNNLVDRLIWVKAPIIIGNEGIPAIYGDDIYTIKEARVLKYRSVKMVGEDMVEILSF
jgi:diaminohydroxyphosphoribosylaminopyrimidine deaminase/5-amino-6-(5-phosphoribosylamino)uracil reductase